MTKYITPGLWTLGDEAEDKKVMIYQSTLYSNPPESISGGAYKYSRTRLFDNSNNLFIDVL